jgi:hypothetical protein
MSYPQPTHTSLGVNLTVIWLIKLYHKSILLVDFDYKVFIVEVLHKNNGFFPCVRECWWAIEDKVRT